MSQDPPVFDVVDGGLGGRCRIVYWWQGLGLLYQASAFLALSL